MKRTSFALAMLAGVASAHAATLWDTGAPHPVNFNGTDTNLGLSSGNIGAGLEQRWIAAPFRIGGGGAIINQIDVDYFIVAGSEADNVNYIIWSRTGLAAPVDGDQVASGVLGAFGAGIDDPRTTAVDDWLHEYSTNIALDAGDYYLTLYGDGGDGANNMPWLTGGDLQAEDLEQDFAWRSATFPNPGFQAYAPASILAGAGMNDAQDRWNVSFALHGTVVPEPMTVLALAAGVAGLARRRKTR